MQNDIHGSFHSAGKQKGFSIMELVFVMAIISVLAVIAVPSFNTWRESIEYRTSARNISIKLRDARSKAITENKQYGVEFDVPNRQYRLRQGNLSDNSTWADITLTPPVGSPEVFSKFVTINLQNITTPNLTGIAFNPNGTSTTANGKIRILDKAGALRHMVNVTAVGRISIK